jgi:hypothetical protein
MVSGRGRALFVVLLGAAAACTSDAPTTVLSILVTDGVGGASLPAKAVLLHPTSGEIQGVGTWDIYDGKAQDRGFCDLGHGVLGTGEGFILPDGSGDLPIGVAAGCEPAPAIPYGTYDLVVLRGIEYEMFQTRVTLTPGAGRITVVAPLERAWTPTGALAADLHVHTELSNDSWVAPGVRVLSELVTGMQVIGFSDHNVNDGLDQIVDTLGVRGQVATINGNEITVDLLHANVFPVRANPALPRGGADSYEQVNPLTAKQFIDYARALPEQPLLQLNHPRLGFAAYFDYSGWNGTTWPPPMPMDFDAVEIISGMQAFNEPGDQRLERSMRDLYTMTEHGRLVAAVGNSDTHHLTGVLAGVPRSYVFVDDTRLDPFDETGFLDAVRARRVVATTGPWLEVQAADGAASGQLTQASNEKVTVSIHLAQAGFVHASRIRVWVANQIVKEMTFDPTSRTIDWSVEVGVGPTDTWIGVDATGDEALPDVVSGPYLRRAGHGGLPPAALINPILVDADGDGKWNPPAAVAAKRLPVPDLRPPPIGHMIDCDGEAMP